MASKKLKKEMARLFREQVAIYKELRKGDKKHGYPKNEKR